MSKLAKGLEGGESYRVAVWEINSFGPGDPPKDELCLKKSSL